MTRSCKIKDHKRLDNCDILGKYAGIEIGHILETRTDPGKWTVLLNSACKKSLKWVGTPIDLFKKLLKRRPVLFIRERKLNISIILSHNLISLIPEILD